MLTQAVALFGAGVASFLAPCLVPLLPAYLGIIAGEPFMFWNAFAGDAQVHLVFMESAASGRFSSASPSRSSCS